MLAAHTRSLTETASRVYMTLSAVSKRVSELEQQVGYSLFERKSRGLELTDAGTELLLHAQNLVSGSERLVRSLAEFKKGLRKRIQIWANTSAIVQFLPEDLYSFRVRYPDVRLALEEKLSSDIVRALQAGDIDLGVVAENTQAEGLEKVRYRQDQLVLVAEGTHPLSEFESVKFEDIVCHDLVGTNEGSAILRCLNDAAASRGHTLKLNIQATSFDAVLRLVEAGYGVGVLPREAVAVTATARRLQLIPIVERWARRNLYLMYRKNSVQSSEVRLLVEHLAAERHARSE